MFLKNCLAAGVAALAMLVAAPEASAKPGRGFAPGRSVAPARPVGGRTIVTPKTVITPKTTFASKTVVTTKGVGGAKKVLASKTLVAAKKVALKPAFVKGLGGKKIQTALYAKKFGFKTKGGAFAYKGLKHGHWSRKWFCGARRCWMWYCPSACGWYYWCPAYGCYLPMNYLPVAAPAEVVNGVAPELPPGANGIPEATGGEVPAVPNNTNTAEKNNTTIEVPEPE
jgi:hypothetical protein